MRTETQSIYASILLFLLRRWKILRYKYFTGRKLILLFFFVCSFPVYNYYVFIIGKLAHQILQSHIGLPDRTFRYPLCSLSCHLLSMQRLCKARTPPTLPTQPALAILQPFLHPLCYLLPNIHASAAVNSPHPHNGSLLKT